MKRLLLDTNAFIWWIEGHRRIDKRARQTIERADAVMVSAASAWEVATKVAIRKLRLPASFAEGIRHTPFQELPVTFAHAERAALLADLHRDPFDRMLIAQSFVEGLTVVTGDPVFAQYGAAVIEV